MKNKFTYWLLLILILLVNTSFLHFNTKKPVIIIDPGHGGWDKGAIGYNDIQEKDIVLNISKEILRLNKAIYNNQVDIYLTRYKDKFIPLDKRAKLVNKLNASLFVSIHCNQLPGHYSTKGLEVYIQNPLKKYPENHIKESIDFGLVITKEIADNLKIKNRGVKFQNFQVLRETIEFAPSILIETAYVSNRVEADYFKEQKNKTAIALAIVSSINTYYKKEVR